MGAGHRRQASMATSSVGLRGVLSVEGVQTRLRAQDRGEGAWKPQRLPDLHLPVGVSLWKSTSELKPNEKVN